MLSAPRYMYSFSSIKIAFTEYAWFSQETVALLNKFSMLTTRWSNAQKSTWTLIFKILMLLITDANYHLFQIWRPFRLSLLAESASSCSRKIKFYQYSRSGGKNISPQKTVFESPIYMQTKTLFSADKTRVNPITTLISHTFPQPPCVFSYIYVLSYSSCSRVRHKFYITRNMHIRTEYSLQSTPLCATISPNFIAKDTGWCINEKRNTHAYRI